MVSSREAKFRPALARSSTWAGAKTRQVAPEADQNALSDETFWKGVAGFLAAR
jgi:hypothetical protein